MEMSPEGGFSERHRNLTDYEMYRLVSFESPRPIPATPGRKGKVSLMEKTRAGMSRLFFEERVEPVTRQELVEAQLHSDHGHHAVEGDKGNQIGH